ncbi:MAG: 30S ribosomal protein S20 [Planctomycetes bacterium]|nr:30S ribosomal protein S20 [Planctomycetota bacterium]
MANLPSAKKRIKQNESRHRRNRARKSAVKKDTRKLLDALRGDNLDAAKTAFVQVTKRIDQVAAKGTLHKNTAARKKSRLARRINAALAAKAD